MVELRKNEQELTAEIMDKVNLSKDKQVLESKVVNLSKCIVNLSKKANVDIGSTEAQVVFVIDSSGSMYDVFRDGTLQNVITTLVPLALTFDDNGKAEVYQFNSRCKKVDDLDLNNYEDYVKNCMDDPESTTKYSGPIKAILEDYFGIKSDGNNVTYSEPKKKGLLGKLFGKRTKEPKEAIVEQTAGSMANTSEYPVFVLYITDGDIDRDDEVRMTALIRESSTVNCFIQFIGASDDKNTKFKYLRELDDLEGRECDNTGFVKFDDLRNVSDTDLYNAVLEQYANWLKVKGF